MNFILGILFSIVMVTILALIPWVGVWVFDFRYIFGVIIPYAALAIFILGIIYRVIKWSLSPNPFRIPTTAGQQKSLPWIKPSRLDNPSTTLGVLGRMFFEIFLSEDYIRMGEMAVDSGTGISLLFSCSRFETSQVFYGTNTGIC
jgi:nitrate reductase gamma subunit